MSGNGFAVPEPRLVRWRWAVWPEARAITQAKWGDRKYGKKGLATA